jgi:8-oxo-dGTP diphosphatase
MQQFVAAKAFIIKDGKVLVIREAQTYSGGAHKGLYDFPGGKIKPGESFIEAIAREVKEECGLAVTVDRPFFAGEWYPLINGEKIQIVGVFFVCTNSSGEVRLGSDHDDLQCIPIGEYEKLPLIPINAEAFRTYLHEHER